MKETKVINPLSIAVQNEIDDSETSENQVSLDEWYRQMAVRKIESEKENLMEEITYR